MINEVDQNKRSLEEVVQEWMDQNQDTVERLDGRCNYVTDSYFLADGRIRTVC